MLSNDRQHAIRPDTFVSKHCSICPCQSLYWLEIDQFSTVILWSALGIVARILNSYVGYI